MCFLQYILTPPPHTVETSRWLKRLKNTDGVCSIIDGQLPRDGDGETKERGDASRERGADTSTDKVSGKLQAMDNLLPSVNFSE